MKKININKPKPRHAIAKLQNTQDINKIFQVAGDKGQNSDKITITILITVTGIDFTIQISYKIVII